MIPTVILHENYSEYLEVNVQITGKNNLIYLIGNENIKFLEKYPNVNFVDINSYLNSEKVKDYKKKFKNRGNYDKHSSWFWFIRMIIIYEFMKEFKLQKVFSCDSDNILLKNINDFQFKSNNAICIPNTWEPYYFTSSVHAGLVSLDFCKKYEELFEEVFIWKNKIELVEKKIKFHKKNPGSFCDMTFYHIIKESDNFEIQNLLDIINIDGNDYTFIQNYANGEGLVSRNQYLTDELGIKLFQNKELKSNMLYDQINEKFINIFNLHFQGKHKQYLNYELLNRLYF